MKKDARKKGAQAGFVVSAELLLISTVLVLGLLTGMTKLRDQTIAELSDTGSAIGAINQSYSVDGTAWTVTGDVAEVSGFAFTDEADVTSNEVGGDGQVINYLPAPTASTTDSGAGELGVQGAQAP